jgi:hypothetical protein
VAAGGRPPSQFVNRRFSVRPRGSAPLFALDVGWQPSRPSPSVPLQIPFIPRRLSVALGRKHEEDVIDRATVDLIVTREDADSEEAAPLGNTLRSFVRGLGE